MEVILNRNIIIDATGSSRWIGGLYYKKNILYSLIQNSEIMDKFKIIVITEKTNKDVFREFESKVTIHYFWYKYQKEKMLKLKLLCLLYRNSYIFPCFDEYFCKKINSIGIYWIPDFQHYHYPQYFSEEERNDRSNYYKKIARSSFPLILSSNDCKNDFRTYCDKDKRNVYVVPFVSYIENNINNLTNDREEKILKKYDLKSRKYILVANQFWKHKNHILVLEAIQILCVKHKNEFCFIFTGKLQDNKDPEYVEQLREKFSDKRIENMYKILGFISREEQLVLMKNAELILQPSLFEGWGTVLEDAKTLNKTVLLSDISVHREQMNEKCILFDPHDAIQLAKLIEKEMKYKHEDSVDIGIADMHKRAKMYSYEFQKLLND